MAKRSATEPLEQDVQKRSCATARSLDKRLQEPCDPDSRLVDAVRAAVQQMDEATGLVQLSQQPLLLGFHTMIPTHHCGYWPASQAIGLSVLRRLDTGPQKERERLMQFLCDLMNGGELSVDEHHYWCRRLKLSHASELGTIKIVAQSWAYELEESDRYVHETRLSPFLFRLTLVPSAVAH